jgi:hypothetical protein
MCTVLLPPGVNPLAIKYTYISYRIMSSIKYCEGLSITDIVYWVELSGQFLVRAGVPLRK